jgi:hypothetical protein
MSGSKRYWLADWRRTIANLKRIFRQSSPNGWKSDRSNISKTAGMQG